MSAFSLQQCLHSELVSCVGWTSPEEVYSAGDDHQILKWNLLTNESSLLVKLNDDVYPTDMQWFPKAGASKKGSASDVFALSSTDGELSQLTVLCCNAPVCILTLSTVLPFVCFVRFVSFLMSFSYIFKLLRCHNTWLVWMNFRPGKCLQIVPSYNYIAQNT